MNESPALACSLQADQLAERGRDFSRLAQRALTRRARKEGAVVLTYRATPEVEEALRELIRREAECCPFLDIELLAGEGELSLRVSAPAGAEGILDLIHESAGL